MKKSKKGKHTEKPRWNPYAKASNETLAYYYWPWHPALWVGSLNWTLGQATSSKALTKTCEMAIWYNRNQVWSMNGFWSHRSPHGFGPHVAHTWAKPGSVHCILPSKLATLPLKLNIEHEDCKSSGEALKFRKLHLLNSSQQIKGTSLSLMLLSQRLQMTTSCWKPLMWPRIPWRESRKKHWKA